MSIYHFILTVICLSTQVQMYAAQMNINQQEKFGPRDAALFKAAIQGADAKAIKTAVENGARINLRDQHGKTALMYAVQLGHGDTVRAFILAGADPSIINPKDNKTAIDYAKSANKEIMQKEIEQALEDKEKEEILAAVRNNDIERLKSFVKTRNPNFNFTIFLDTPLILATRSENISIMRFLAEHGADVNIPDINGNTALMWAVAHVSPEMVKLLIAKGADVSRQNDKNETALDWSLLMLLNSKKEDLEIIKLLIAAGADVNKQNEWGTTSLKFAVNNNFQELTKLLIDAGAKVNIPDRYGKTVLMTAASHGPRYSEMIKFLITNGADPAMKDTQGKTALDYAKDNDDGFAIEKVIAEGLEERERRLKAAI
jgi:ankyrin repeat protein